MSAQLIDTGPIVYIVPGQQPIWRHCRTWITSDGRTLSVVTELPADTGMSITNAAEEVRAALEATWGARCRIIEHYPWPDDEHYDEQARTSTGGMNWWRLNTDDLRAELGQELQDSRPTLPITPTEAGPASCSRCRKTSDTCCRICHRDLCRDCSIDHHHEDYGTSASASW